MRDLMTTALEPTLFGALGALPEDKGAAIVRELPRTLLTLPLPLPCCNGIAEVFDLARELPPHCGVAAATWELDPVGKQRRSRVSTVTPLRCMGKKYSPTCSQSLPNGVP
mmetsp:Transcript_133832/g.260602  ORF Transcript_133832/g.260602 Transcript_133832/m.260602 type:complete len:110 (+) Transcript_133832:261-590(+)